MPLAQAGWLNQTCSIGSRRGQKKPLLDPWHKSYTSIGPFLVPWHKLLPRWSLYLFHLCQLVTKSGSTRPWNCSSDLRGRGMLSRSLGPMILVFCPVHDTHMKLVRTRVLMVTARDKQMRDQSSPRGRGSR